MALKVTKFEKPKKRTAKAKASPVDLFLAACDIQIRIANGETVLRKQTKKPIKSWGKDIYGQQAICPKVGNSLLLGKNAGFSVKGTTAVAILKELKAEVTGGKHVRIINRIAKRKGKKSA